MLLNGLLSVHKPAGITSAHVVAIIKKILSSPGLFIVAPARNLTSLGRPAKVGHGGTLDMGAEGVLVLGVGTYCTELTHLLKGDKKYSASGLLGASSDTYDASGVLSAPASTSAITQAMVTQSLLQFQGEIRQQPPLYSALKVDGKRLSDYARAGVAVAMEVKTRTVNIYSLSLTQFDNPAFSIGEPLECICLYSAITIIHLFAHNRPYD